MKKIYAFAVVAALGCNVAVAQGPYVKLGIGYGLPQGTQTLNANGAPFSGSINNANGTTLYDVNRVSFTSGLNASVGAGYMFSKYVGVEIAGDFFFNSKTYTSKAINVLNPGGAYYSDEVTTTKGKLPIYLIPAMVIQSGGNKLNAYARGGIAMPVSAGMTMQSDYTYYNVLKSVEHYDQTIKMKNTLGFAGAMGARFNMTDNVALWGEINLLLSNIYVKQANVTAHNVDGQDLQNPAPGTTIKYGSNGTVSSTEAPAYSLPYSNVGLRVGLSFNLGKPKDNDNNRKK
jgi:hypothetical protein